MLLKNILNKMNMLSILNKYDIDGFDKEGGTDKNIDHSYLEIYENLLKKYVDKHVNLIEVGTKYGGSALLFHDFLPKSNLVLIDNVNIIHNKILKNINKDRYIFLKNDAYTNYTIEKLKQINPNGYDIIIDDGPHTLISQILFIKKYLKILKDDGLLIIEDIQSVNNLNILLNHIPFEFKHKVKIIDLRKIKNKYDDILICIQN